MMEIFINVAESLEDILKSDLIRIDLQIVKDQWVGYAYYKNKKTFKIVREGGFYEV